MKIIPVENFLRTLTPSELQYASTLAYPAHATPAAEWAWIQKMRREQKKLQRQQKMLLRVEYLQSLPMLPVVELRELQRLHKRLTAFGIAVPQIPSNEEKTLECEG